MDEKTDNMMSLQDIRNLLWRRHQNPGTRLRELIKREGRFIAPGCGDGMDAALVRKVWEDRREKGLPCQYNGVYFSGWLRALSRYWPDIGPNDITSMFQAVSDIVCGAYPLPTLVDGETGLGATRMNISQLVILYASAGVAMWHLEDQKDHKCGQHGGKELVDLEDFLTKAKIALATQAAIPGCDMLLCLRTDAFSAYKGGMEEALRRGKAYADISVQVYDEESGQMVKRKADYIWFEFPNPDPGPAREIAQEMKRHSPQTGLAFNCSPNHNRYQWFADRPQLKRPTYDTYVDMGYDVIFHTIWSGKVRMQAQYDWNWKMAEHGVDALYDMQKQLIGHPTESAQTMVRTPDFQRFDQFIDDRMEQILASSQGFGSNLTDAAQVKAVAVNKIQ